MKIKQSIIAFSAMSLFVIANAQASSHIHENIGMPPFSIAIHGIINQEWPQALVLNQTTSWVQNANFVSAASEYPSQLVSDSVYTWDITQPVEASGAPVSGQFTYTDDVGGNACAVQYIVTAGTLSATATPTPTPSASGAFNCALTLTRSGKNATLVLGIQGLK